MAQLFLNKDNEVRYARVRHYSHKDSVTRKPQFTYCKLEDLDALKTLLKSQGISLSIDRSEVGHIGQRQTIKNHDLENTTSSLKQKNTCGLGIVWLELQLPKLTTRVQIPETAFPFWSTSFHYPSDVV